MVTTEHGVETVSMYVLTPAVPLSYMGMLRVYLYDKQLLTGADDDNDETLYNLATEGVHEFYLGRYSTLVQQMSLLLHHQQCIETGLLL